MNAISAIRTGLVRSFGAPRMILTLWLVNVVLALPLAIVLGASVHASVQHSLVSDQLVRGFDTAWHSEYVDATRGLGTTLDPAVVGVGAFLQNLEAWWSGRLFRTHGFPGLLAMGLFYALVWAFLLGGVLQRFTRPQGFEGQVFSQTFFGNCGRFFFRFVRLALFSGVLYLGIYALARAYFRGLQRWTRDVTVERTVLLWVLVGAAVVVVLLVLVRLVFDLAKVMAVLEDRRGMLITLGAALRCFAGRPVTLLGLYLGLGLLWVVGLVVYAWVAPTAGPASWLGVLLAFLLAQALLAAKIGLRLSLLAGELAVYREAVSGAES
jgi:hypothetical protein